MVNPSSSVEKIFRILSSLEIKVYKAKVDESLCFCKKDLLIMFIRRLQHIVMLATSARYILEDDSIKEIIDYKLAKIRSELENTTATDEVSYVVEKFYLELIEKIISRYKITTDKLMSIKHYDSYLRNLGNRVQKVYEKIFFVFKVTYPVCSLFNYSYYCTSFCKSQCLNKELFGQHNTILLPADYVSMNSYEKTLYSYILETFLGFTDPSTLRFAICGTKHKDILTSWVIQHGFSYDKISFINDCPIELEDLRLCSRGVCYVR